MKTKISILITFFLFSVNINAQVDRTKQPKPGPAPEIQLQTPVEFTLNNGLKVMVVENHKLPRVSYNLTIDNTPAFKGSKKGVSDILSTMLGNGTTSITKDDFNEEVDFLGASISFGSSSGFASGLSKYSERILELMSDATMNPLFTEDEFQKEKEKQIEGLKANEKSVDAVASRVALALTYGTHHPSGEFVSKETLDTVTFSDVKSHYIENFNPGNAYLVVIGDVDFNTIKKQITNTFGLWIKGTSLNLEVPEASANVQYTQINFIDMPNAVQSSVAVMNTTKLKMNDPDYHAVLITNHILGGGGNAYLYLNLREDHGYTYGSYSGINANKYVSRFRASASVRNMVTDSSIVQILNEIKRIRTENVDHNTLTDAKAKYVGNFVMALENPQTIAGYALNIKLNDLPQDFYETYLKKINAVTAEDVKRVANKHFKVDNARIVVVGKGSEVLENLEKTGIPIKYFDTYANPVEKPEFSKPIPEDVTAQSIIDHYITAIGGKEKAMTVKTVYTSANVTIEGVPLKLTSEIKKMTPNKESMEMTAEGMGVLMKQKFNGEAGFVEQQGMKKPLTEEEVAEKKSDYSIFPELYYDAANVSLELMTTIDGQDVFKIKISNGEKDTFKYYNAETGLLLRQESEVEAQGQSFLSVVNYSEYSPVNGVQFPYIQSIKSGPQTISMNINNVIVNEGVTDADFED